MKPAAIAAALLLACLPNWAVAEGTASASQPPSQRPDTLVARVEIRARGRLHGEIRLVRRGRGVVLQTLLVTRTLERVAARIRDKEKAAWPKGSDGREESRRYLEALAGAVEQVLLGERSDRYRRLLIELRLAPGVGIIAFANPTTSEQDDQFRILSSDGIRELTSSCVWVRRSFERIAADRGLSLAAVSPLPSC